MTRKVQVVIGAGYGDEGKGLMTDYFTEKFFKLSDKVIVCRFNGGAQAGHTVHRDNQRHEFSHFGSGSLQNAATYLGKEFVCSPMLFIEEYEELRKKTTESPVVYVHEDCQITTPFDIMINQIIEKYRAGGRHGSCGMGFAETIERHVNGGWQVTTFVNYFKSHKINPMHRLKKIRKYAIERLLTLMELPRDTDWKHIETLIGVQDFNNLFRDDILEKFVEDVKFFLGKARVVNTIPSIYEHVVCEGAQGLQLAQYGGNFPYVTRSNTGVQNVVTDGDIDWKKDDIGVTYVTRCYQTKHGAGPFSNEVSTLSNIAVVDPTNQPNDFQGSLRFAPLDISKVLQCLLKDAVINKVPIASVSLAVTCLDQIENDFEVIIDGKASRISTMALVDLLTDVSKLIGLKNIYFSTGNSASKVVEGFSNEV